MHPDRVAAKTPDVPNPSAEVCYPRSRKVLCPMRAGFRSCRLRACCCPVGRVNRWQALRQGGRMG